MKNIAMTNAVSIRNIRFSNRSASITWKFADQPKTRTSRLYMHTDGTWHFDSDTQKLDEGIQKHLMKKYCDRCADLLYKETNALNRGEIYIGIPSELQRIENALYKEERYREALKRLYKKEKEMADDPDSGKKRIGVWYQGPKTAAVFRT